MISVERVRCLLGLHRWRVGKYVTYCARCYSVKRQ